MDFLLLIKKNESKIKPKFEPAVLTDEKKKQYIKLITVNRHFMN